MLKRPAKPAKKKKRTMSERQCWWDKTNAYGRATAEAAGVRTEEDIVKVIHSARGWKPSTR